MSLKFDPDGGDLGRGKKISTFELYIVAPYIADLLQTMYDDESGHYKYSFEVFSAEKLKLEIVMNTILLPKDVSWYSIDGRKAFEMRGASGGVVTALACYLVTGVKK